MNAYSFNIFTNQEKEDEEVVKTYVRYSGYVIFIHHTITLAIIMALALYDPSFLPHWTSSEFRLNPSDYHFFYIFGITMIMGWHSLTEQNKYLLDQLFEELKCIVYEQIPSIYD